MVMIKPFRAFRPYPKRAHLVASPPYDVLSSKEAREIVKGNPFSFLHISKPEIDLPPSVNQYDQMVYEKGFENLKSFIMNGYLLRDKFPSLYLYEQTMGDHVQAGVVCAVSVKDYENNRIKKHENTRQDKEDDRMKHIKTLNAQAEPVFLVYKANEKIEPMISSGTKERPIYDFICEDGVRHRLWTISERSKIDEFISSFGKISSLYVADGHHRSAASCRLAAEMRNEEKSKVRLSPFEFFLAVIFPHNSTKILEYNRVITDLGSRTADEFLKTISKSFTFKKTDEPKPAKRNEFGMFLDGSWYNIIPKEGTFSKDDPIKSLDVSILQDNLLDPVLGIKDQRTDKRISFVGGIKGYTELEKRCNEDAKIAFLMYPTGIEQLLDVADRGLLMPPKSTWFEPKLRSGLFVRMLDENV